jgi:hypothetical protein
MYMKSYCLLNFKLLSITYNRKASRFLRKFSIKEIIILILIKHSM